MTNKKKTIAIDIDDVLSAHAQAFAEYSNKKYGTNITADDYQEKWQDVWKIELGEAIKRANEYHESDHLSLCETIDGSHDALKKLKERFRLIALTSRRDSISKLTKDWLEKHYPNIFDEVIFAGFYNKLTVRDTNKRLAMTKGELAKNIGANYIIDDQPKHVLSCVELGMSGILFGNYTWNKINVLPKKTVRLNNWSEVLNYFDSE